MSGRLPVTILVQGGIASGKSTISRLLAQRGAEPIDCDALAHQALETPAARQAVREAFGPEVFADDGAVDRAALARVVFADEAALQRLEAILHPMVGERVRAALVAAAVAEGEPRRVAVIDAAVADKMKMVEAYDLVLFVDTSPETRRRRAAERGWAPGEIERREAQQSALAPKRAAADYVVVNDGDLAEAESHVERFWTDHVEPRR